MCLETYAAIRKAPDTSTGLRPTLSIQITAGMVDKNVLHRNKQGATSVRSGTYAIPTTPVARRERAFPVRPNDWKMVGA